MSETVYDLHSHSLASDGTLSPADLVARAARFGVGVLALSDHDTTAGVPDARAAAAGHGLELVPAVEVSVTWNNRTLHIVGLHVDLDHRPLQAGLARLRDYRHWRAREIARRLERHGIPEPYEGARSYARGTIISRTHFAQHLVALGRAGSVREVFKHYLVSGRPGHVHGEWAGLEEAVGWIRGAGGQAVIAHPARYKLTATKLRELISDFQDLGGEGIEVVSGSHGRDEVLAMAAHARRSGLLASVGSDFHGPGNAFVELGALAPLPDGCRPVWSAW